MPSVFPKQIQTVTQGRNDVRRCERSAPTGVLVACRCTEGATDVIYGVLWCVGESHEGLIVSTVPASPAHDWAEAQPITKSAPQSNDHDLFVDNISQRPLSV